MNVCQVIELDGSNIPTLYTSHRDAVDALYSDLTHPDRQVSPEDAVYVDRR